MLAAPLYQLGPAERVRVEELAAEALGVFVAAGYVRAELPIIQPADLYLNMAGEGVRERMYVFDDPAGKEMCLRADLTIPLCRSVLDQDMPQLPTRLACAGPVFRFDLSANEAGAAELLQVGIECLGVEDALVADIEVFAQARSVLACSKVRSVEVEVGDLALFPALLADLDLDEAWARRLLFAFRHPSLLPATLEAMRSGENISVPRYALEFADADLSSVERHVQTVLRTDDVALVGRRTVSNIAERLIDKAKMATAKSPPAKSLAAIDAFLDIQGASEDCLKRLKGLAGPSAGGLAKALDRFSERIKAIQKLLGAEDALRVSTTRGRRFHYYTGFVFNVRVPGLDWPVAAGGRYDNLMGDLGATHAIPAVGCAVWPEWLLAAELSNDA